VRDRVRRKDPALLEFCGRSHGCDAAGALVSGKSAEREQRTIDSDSIETARAMNSSQVLRERRDVIPVGLCTSALLYMYSGTNSPLTSAPPATIPAPVDDLVSPYSSSVQAQRSLTSSSILASAMSCSLPLPLATFCASCICDLTASSLNSSRGNPSTALMLRTEFGWTTAKPPETETGVSIPAHRSHPLNGRAP
jgi:hypothetical protein